MARTRYLVSSLFLVPLGLLASHEAGAAGSLRPAVPEAPDTVTQLPDGIHRTSHGRFTRDLCDHHKHGYCLSHVLLPEGWKPGDAVPRGEEGKRRDANPPAGQMGPTDLMAAYNIPPSSAANGKIVAIIDEPDSHAWTDMNAYRTGYGIPTLPKCDTTVNNGNPTGSLPACFKQISNTGGTPGADGGSSADGETSLDLDMVSAVCPDCSIVMVTFPQFSDAELIQSVAEAATLGAVATSISWGTPEGENGPGYGAGADPTGNNYTTPGHLVLAASGDAAYDFADDPKLSPYTELPVFRTRYPRSRRHDPVLERLHVRRGCLVLGERPLRTRRHDERLQHRVPASTLAGDRSRVGVQCARDG